MKVPFVVTLALMVLSSIALLLAQGCATSDDSDEEPSYEIAADEAENTNVMADGEAPENNAAVPATEEIGNAEVVEDAVTAENSSENTMVEDPGSGPINMGDLAAEDTSSTLDQTAPVNSVDLPANAQAQQNSAANVVTNSVASAGGGNVGGAQQPPANAATVPLDPYGFTTAPTTVPEVMPTQSEVWWVGYDYRPNDGVVRIEIMAYGTPQYDIFREMNQSGQPELVVRFYETALQLRVRRDIDASEFRSPVAYVRMRWSGVGSYTDVVMTLRDAVQPRLYAKKGNVILTFPIPERYRGNSTGAGAPVAATQAEILQRADLSPIVDEASDKPKAALAMQAPAPPYVPDPAGQVTQDMPADGGAMAPVMPNPPLAPEVPANSAYPSNGNAAVPPGPIAVAEPAAANAGSIEPIAEPVASPLPANGAAPQNGVPANDAPANDTSENSDEASVNGEGILPANASESLEEARAKAKKTPTRGPNGKKMKAKRPLKKGQRIEKLDPMRSAPEKRQRRRAPPKRRAPAQEQQAPPANGAPNPGGNEKFFDNSIDDFDDGEGESVDDTEKFEVRQRPQQDRPNWVRSFGLMMVAQAVGEAPAAAQTAPVVVPVTEVPSTADLANEVQGKDTDGPAEARFTGRPINIDFRGAKLSEVVRTLAAESGANVVFPPTFKDEEVNISLKDVPWDEALKVVLDAHELGMIKEGRVLLIDKLVNLTQHRALLKQATLQQSATAPTKILIIRLSYAKASTIVGTLSSILQGAGAATVGLTRPPAQMNADDRTNSLVVEGTPDDLSKIKSLVERLDLQTPQVEISSRVIEVQKSTSDFLGIAWVGGINMDPGRGLGFGTLPFPNSLNTTYAVDPGVGINEPAKGVGTMDLRFGSLNSFIDLDMRIALEERRGTTEILEANRVIVQDNQNATISSGINEFFQVFGRDGPGELATVSNNISLNVTPHITADGQVDMILNLTSNNSTKPPNATAVSATATKEVRTKLLRKNGETVVIGGIQRAQKEKTQVGIPVLMDLPIIGALFRRTDNSERRSDLLVLVTPRIVGSAISGTSGGDSGDSQISDYVPASANRESFESEVARLAPAANSAPEQSNTVDAEAEVGANSNSNANVNSNSNANAEAASNSNVEQNANAAAQNVQGNSSENAAAANAAENEEEL